jgi:hypothetical protein
VDSPLVVDLAHVPPWAVGLRWRSYLPWASWCRVCGAEMPANPPEICRAPRTELEAVGPREGGTRCLWRAGEVLCPGCYPRRVRAADDGEDAVAPWRSLPAHGFSLCDCCGEVVPAGTPLWWRTRTVCAPCAVTWGLEMVPAAVDALVHGGLVAGVGGRHG